MDEAGPDTPLQRGFFTPRAKRVPVPPPPPAESSAPVLPDRHGGTAFAVLGREPTVAFATWDLPAGVGEDWRVVILAGGEGCAPVRFEFPAHAHGAYLQGLQPGGRYLVRAQLESPSGSASAFTPPVAELALPPALPVLDAEVRFARVPWAASSAPAYPAPVAAAPLPLHVCTGATSPGAAGEGPAPGASRPVPSALRPVVPLPTSPARGWATSPNAP